MKKIKIIMSFIALGAFCTAGMSQFIPGDIAERYAKYLGYNVEYDTVNITDYVVLPNGERVRPMKFYLGLAGQEYSYCVKKGFTITNKTINIRGRNKNIAVCEDKNRTQKSLLRILIEDGVYSQLYQGAPLPPPDDSIPPVGDPGEDPGDIYFPPVGYPKYFDYRDQQFISPPQMQGWLSTCFAFASTAVAEAVYTKETSSFVSLSPACIAFCGASYYPGYISPYEGMLSAGDENWSFRMMCEHGVLKDEDYAYCYNCNQEATATMACHDWRWQDVDRIAFNEYVAVGNNSTHTDPIEIMNAIQTYGPVYAVIWSNSAFKAYPYPGWNGDPYAFLSKGYSENGEQRYIHRQTIDSNYIPKAYLHAVAIVGWGVDGTPFDGGLGLYWIVKNSWTDQFNNGLWGYGGYGYVAANSLMITSNVSAIKYEKRIISKFGSNGCSTMYSIHGLPPSYSSLSWSIDNSDASITNSTSQTCLVQPANSSIRGVYNLTCTIHYNNNYQYPSSANQSPAYNERVTKEIWIGTPPEPPAVNCLTSNPDATTQTYQVTNQGAPGTYETEWETSGGVYIIEISGNICTVGVNYSGTLTARFAPSCTNSATVIIITRTVTHVTPVITCLTTDPCAGNREYSVFNFNDSGASSIHWMSSGGIQIQGSSTGTSCTVHFDGEGYIEAEFIYTDGDNRGASVFISWDCPSFQMSPNPANTEISVDVDVPHSNNPELEYSLLSNDGVQKKHKISATKHEVFNIQDLVNGTYSMIVIVKIQGSSPIQLSKTFVVSH